MTIGTPRNEEEVTTFSPGVATGTEALPISSGVPGDIAPAIGRAGDIQVNNAVSVFLGCLCLRELLRPHILNGKQGFIGYNEDCV